MMMTSRIWLGPSASYLSDMECGLSRTRCSHGHIGRGRGAPQPWWLHLGCRDQDAAVAAWDSASAWVAAIWTRTSSMSSARTPSMTCSRAEAGSAPGWLKTRMPWRKAIRVGMEVIRAEAANDCSASVSTLPKTMSGWVELLCSKTGANERHGPHQAAQKSTRTMSLSSSVCPKDSAVSAWVVMISPSRLHESYLGGY